MQTATVSELASASTVESSTSRYARAIQASKRIRWDIDRDVIRGRNFDFSRTFLPSSLSKVDELEFLDAAERRLLSQVQGRSYVNIFGLVERYIGAKVLQLSGQHWLGDQVALEALVRFSDEELKHQELFRRLEAMLAARMPSGYVPVAEPNAVARFVLGKRTWAVLALTSHIELFTQSHYKQSIEPRDWETLVAHNDLELYDTQADPDEIVNLAFKPDAEKSRILELNAKVNALIDSEIGVDNGSMYPGPTERYHTI